MIHNASLVKNVEIVPGAEVVPAFLILVSHLGLGEEVDILCGPEEVQQLCSVVFWSRKEVSV